MKNKNALTVRSNPGLSELKRAENLLRITSEILGKPVVPGHNRTDEHGRKQGHWVERNANGDVFEGAYVDDKRHGPWVLRFADGGVQEGPFVDGKRHGHWVERFASGNVYEGPYVDGKQHGQWVWRFTDGVWEGQFVNGERHGRWVSRKPNGTEAVTHWHHGEIVK